MQTKKPLILFDIDYTLFDTDLFKKSQLIEHKLYDEVVHMLRDLQKIATLGIFSEGAKEFQFKKLVETKIHDFFADDHIHIVEKKGDVLASLLEKYADKTLYLVDDKLSVLNEAKRQKPDLFAIWVKRGKYAERQKPIPGFIPDKIVLSLRDITKFVGS